MRIKGYESGVGFWYVLWREREHSNMDVYLKFNGLANWFAREAYKGLPVLRVGRMVATDKGFDEKECWSSREEFVEWARPLAPFPLP